MGRPFREYLDGRKIYACKFCRSHLTCAESLVSKAFHSKSGPAYLFSKAVNVVPGPQEERMLTTGLHVVCDVFCLNCSSYCGWKYEMAYEKSQKYKEGKVILERSRVVDLGPSDGGSSSSDGCGGEDLCDASDNSDEDDS